MTVSSSFYSLKNSGFPKFFRVFMTSKLSFIKLLAPLLLIIKEKHSIVCLPSECQVWGFSRRYELIVIYRLCFGNFAMKKAKVKCLSGS